MKIIISIGYLLLSLRQKFTEMLKSSFTRNLIEAGCDEAGRGCLAGPVIAAAVILPKNFRHKILNDSKQLSRIQRNELRLEIEEKAIAWSVAEASSQEIDEINILNASFLAMHRAIKRLQPTPELLLIDGNRFKKFETIQHECIIKGDCKFLSIAAASILAKTYRDQLMIEFSEKFCGYNWHTNMGYPTVEHREGIKKYGLTEIHRKSFQQLPSQLELFKE
jgi:ribonuclease HII